MGDRMYRVCLTVPLGKREGTMLLRETDGRVDGWITLMKKKNSLSGVLSGEGRLTLSGVIRTLVGTVNYTATGAVVGQKVFLNFRTDTGKNYPLTGEEYC
jgi:hypothetical protein